MSSIYRALSRWATLSAIALSIFTSSTTSFASETSTLTTPATASSFSAPFDLVTDDHGQAPAQQTGWVYLPPFDFPDEVKDCSVCRFDGAPFVLFSI